MARKIPFLLALSCATIPAQHLVTACQPPAEIRSLSLEQLRTQLNAGRDDFFLYKRLLDLTPTAPKPGILADQFRQRLDQHPDDASFLYLYALSLIGRNTPAAIRYLNRASSLAPGLPWTYASLADIYVSPNFRDNAQAIANLREYRKLCPANLDAFRHFNKVKDPAVTAEWAAQLRALLENDKDPEDSLYWTFLWAAEFRLAPAPQYDVLRSRVSADVQRLDSMPEHGNRNLLKALDDGYKLIGQREAARKIENQLYPDADQEAFNAYQAWEEKHQLRRTSKITEEEYQVIHADFARVAAEWVARWPSSPFAWQTRLNTLALTPNWTKQEMEKAGDEVLKTDAANPMGWNYTPRKLRVAQTWVRHGIRLKDCVSMGQESLDQLSLGPEVASDLTAPKNAAQIAAAGSFGFDTAVWDAMSVVVEGSTQLGDLDKSRNMLARMRKWLDENQARKDDRTSGYMHFQARYLYYAGEVAEGEGHPLDALALYVRAIAGGWHDSEAMKHGRQLWDQQGGTEQGWELSIQRLPAPVAGHPQARPAGTAPSEFAAWKVYKPGQALPDMNLRDTSGKTWTLADLKGKTTFVNLWATWCAPCREELPHLQKLYELVRQRPDIQVITLNVDENPGQLQPFLTENPFTFPVLMAWPYVEEFVGPVTIPQNWLVDPTGTLRQKSIGFDTKSPNWPQKMLDMLQLVPGPAR